MYIESWRYLLLHDTIRSRGENRSKETHHKVSSATEHFSRNAAVGAAGVFGIQHVTVKDKKHTHRILALHLLTHHAWTRNKCHPHLFTTQLPWTSSATCWMQRSTAVESVPEASSPIRVANAITLTTSKGLHYTQGFCRQNNTSKHSLNVNV